MKPAITKNLWAPLITPKRGRPWIDYSKIASTRMACRFYHLDGLTDKGREMFASITKYVRVTVTEQPEGKV